MKTRTQNILVFAARNLSYGGAVFILTAAYIMYAQPSNLVVGLSSYTGNPLVLGGVMMANGVLASLLGYSVRRWLDSNTVPE